MDINAFWGNIFKNHLGERDEIPAILQKVPIFEDLKVRDLRQIERILHKREYRPGEVIFNEGDPGLGMYIIGAGAVDIVRRSTGHVMAELQAGEFFGELALLDDSPRTASAVARTSSKMLCFFQPDLMDLLERNPRLGVAVLFKLARTIGERLKKTNELMTGEPGSLKSIRD